MKFKSFSFLFVLSSVFIILFSPHDVFALNDGAGVAFADTRGEIITSFDYDYEVNTYVKNVKYIYMYTASDNIKGNGYNLFYDFAFITPLNYGMGMQPIYFLSNRQEINFSKSWQLVDQYALGDRYYTRYHMNIDYIAQSTNANYQLTLQLNSPVDIIFYSVYNKKFSQTSGSSSSEIEAGVKDIIDNQNKNTDKITQNNDKNTDKIVQGQQQIKDTLTDDNVSGSKDKANSFFNDFKTDDFGLSGIITAPLSTIKSITSVSCSPLVLPLPFVNQNLTLPCIRSIFEEHFSSLLLIYQTITTGILSYYIIVRLFNLVKDFKNPEHDEIEVMDL